MLRNNPRYFCRYLVLTNIFILLYFVISSETVLDNSVVSNENFVTADQSEKLALNRTDSDQDKPFKFINFELNTWSESQRFELKDSSSSDQFFITFGKHECYKLGSNEKMSSPVKGCVCRRGYHGPHCGIPTSSWQSYYKDKSHEAAKLRPRKQPRRLIHGLQVNHETDLFEARLEMLDKVVDVYLVLESNYSSYGTPKPLTFLDKFRSGWLSSFQQKLLYVFLPYFPKEGETNGWYADSFLRMYLGKKGMAMVEGAKDDDIFLLLDADELPSLESLMFLKLFDGWTEPVKFGFRWTVFGFFWLEAEEPGIVESIPFLAKILNKKASEKLLTLYVACTVGMLRDVYGNNAWSLRKNLWSHKTFKDRLLKYNQTHAKPQEWTLGDLGHYGGWHCSWCYNPQGIRQKLVSAQRHDKPRWGDYPEKLDLDYIARLVEEGEWFDGKRPFIRVDRRKTPDDVYAPPYFLENEDRFEYLMVPPQDRL